MSIKLMGEQRRVLSLPHNTPILIRGVAGSGKTTLAVLRAKHIANIEGDLWHNTHVCIFSYTKSLTRFVRSMIDVNDTKITVTGFHSWAHAFLKERKFWEGHDVAKSSLVNSILLSAISRLQVNNENRSILKKHLDFYKEEIAWIKGKMVCEKSEYLLAKRVGRGTSDRVTAQDKEVLWSLYELYCTGLRDHDEEITYIDYDDFALWVLKYIEDENDFVPPYSHIVIDEAQDLNASQLAVIKKIVTPETNSLTIIADAAQQIYKSGFTWSDLGINVRGGRSIELKRNYRNTFQIAETAESLLSHDPQYDALSKVVFPDRQGPKPKVLHLEHGKQLKYLLERLKRINLSEDSLVILHRRRKVFDQIIRFLKEQEYEPKDICHAKTAGGHQAGLYTCTMHSVKGLEFDHVIICDVNDDIIPSPDAFASGEDELHTATERRLLYTCMTRARLTLSLISSENPSRYLAEISPSTIDSVE